MRNRMKSWVICLTYIHIYIYIHNVKQQCNAGKRNKTQQSANGTYQAAPFFFFTTQEWREKLRRSTANYSKSLDTVLHDPIRQHVQGARGRYLFLFLPCFSASSLHLPALSLSFSLSHTHTLSLSLSFSVCVCILFFVLLLLRCLLALSAYLRLHLRADIVEGRLEEFE